MTVENKKSTILVIDDEEANVRLLAMSLRADGYQVQTALSGEDGLAVFKNASPDLVLTDIKMPGMDGIQVLRQIKTMNPGTEVIIITGHGDIDNAIEALQFGASDFINKPVRDEALAVAIQRAEEKQSIKRQLRNYTDTLEQRIQQATREITRQSNFLAKLIKSSNDGIVATDRFLSIVLFNPEAERIFAFNHEDVVGKKTITDLLPPELSPFFEKKHFTGHDPAWKEIDILNRDGLLIPVRFYGTFLYEKNEQMGTVCFFQDLRPIKRLETELLRSERLAAIGQTVAGVAHSVKNILHGFKGGSYLVDLGIEHRDDTKLRQGWDMIQRNIGRTSDLVLDLLSYSKERSPACEVCDPNDIVHDVSEVMQVYAEKHSVSIVLDLDDDIGAVSIDPRTLHQCLTNLISNAIDACLFDEDTRKQWQVRISTQRDKDDAICLSVSDNGTGITPELKDKLFSSFFSTKGHRGTGLGLLVTQKLVEEHGGSIELASELGKGTTFTIRLPFCPESTSLAPDNGAPVKGEK